MIFLAMEASVHEPLSKNVLLCHHKRLRQHSDSAPFLFIKPNVGFYLSQRADVM